MNKNKIIKNRKRKEGFTLIEVLVTVSIIAIISSAAIVNYTGAQDKAKESMDYSTAANIATAAQLALADNASNITIDSLVSGGYLQSKPTPKSDLGNAFNLSITGGKVSVTLGGKTLYPNTSTSNNSNNNDSSNDTSGGN